MIQEDILSVCQKRVGEKGEIHSMTKLKNLNVEEVEHLGHLGFVAKLSNSSLAFTIIYDIKSPLVGIQQMSCLKVYAWVSDEI